MNELGKAEVEELLANRELRDSDRLGNYQFKKRRYAVRTCKLCKKEFPPTVPWMYLCHTCGEVSRYEKRQARFRKYYKKNKDIILAKNRDQMRAIRISCLVAYGGDPPACSCCGENHREFLSIHHVNNDGAQDRLKPGRWGSSLFYTLMKLNYPPGYAVLCHNCNMALSHFGRCPHKENKNESKKP